MAVPTYSELFTSIQSDLRNKLDIKTILGKVVLNVFAAVQAGKLKIFYLRSAFVQKNVFPDQADPESLGGTLERFGFVKLNRFPLPATAGVYTVEVNGDIGATIAPGTTYKSLDTSSNPDKLFVLDNSFTFTSTTGNIELRALDLGKEAELIVSDQLQVTQPIANVDSFGEVIAIVDEPLEAETADEYRQKVIAAYRTEPQGGAKSDYMLWSLDAQGVRRSYPYVKDGESGVIDLYVEANPADSIDGNGTPSAAILDDVEEVVEFDPDVSKLLEERGRRPMGTFQINFLPIVTLPVDVTITNLSDTSFLTSIADAIVAFLFDIRPFIDGADNPNNSQQDLLYESDIYGVVRGVLGSQATFESLTVKVDEVQISIYEFTDGDIPYLRILSAV